MTHGDEIIKKTATAAFWQNYESMPDMLEGLVMRTTSTSATETYPWLAYAPGVHEMHGSRDKRSVPELSWSITNIKWESTVVIDYETRKFQKIGAVSAMLSDLGRKAGAYPSERLSTRITTGDATACYDTQYFFAAAHTDPGAAYTTSQDNDFTSAIVSATAPTELEFAAACRGMIDAMYGFKDGDGDPVVPSNPRFICMVPPGYRSIAERVAKVNQLTGPVGNDLQGSFEVRVNPWLDAPATTAEFFMFNASGARKPFIYQVATPTYLEDDIDKQNEFETKDVSFGSFGYWEVHYGDWRYATRHIFTTA